MIRLDKVSKMYRTERIETTALDNINLEVGAGEYVSMLVPSGRVTTNLLQQMRLLDAQ